MGKKRGNKRNANPITLGSTDGATGGKNTANKEQEKKEEIPSKSDVGDKQSEEHEPDKAENISGAEGAPASKSDDTSEKCDFQRQTSTKSALELLAEIDDEPIEKRSKSALELLDEVDQEFHLPEVLQPKVDILDLETVASVKDDEEDKNKDDIEELEVKESKDAEEAKDSIESIVDASKKT